MSNSWKSHGGIDDIYSFNVIDASAVIANNFFAKQRRPTEQIFNGTLEVTVDLKAGNNILVGKHLYARNSISTLVDLFINRDSYINNKLFFVNRDKTSDLSTVDISSTFPIDTSHAFLNGTFSNIGVNIVHPKSIFHVSSTHPSATNIITVDSSNDYIKTILNRNKNQKGIMIDASNTVSNVFFNNDSSMNIGNPNATIQYASGGYLFLQTNKQVNTESRKFVIENSAGIFVSDASGVNIDTSGSILFDTSNSFFLDTSRGFFHMDASTGLLQLGTTDDFNLHTSLSGGLFQMNDDLALVSTSGEFFLNSSGGLISIDATNEGIIQFISSIFNLKTTLNFAPQRRNISSTKLYGETLSVYDSSNTVFLEDIYDLSYIKTGNALTALAIDNSSNTNIKFVAPNTGKGAHIGGGAYPIDSTRSMGLFGLTDLSHGFTNNQLFVSNKNKTKYASTLGINTFKPNLDKYVMDINGPVYISSGEINTVANTEFEIFNMHFSKSHPLVGIASGSPSSVKDNAYTQFLIYTSDGGKNWRKSNIYEKENVFEAEEGVLDQQAIIYDQCFMLDNSYGLVSGNDSNLFYTNNGGEDWFKMGYGLQSDTFISTGLGGSKVNLYGEEVYRFFNVFQAANIENAKSKIRYFDISASHIDASLNGQDNILQVGGNSFEIAVTEFNTQNQSIENIRSLDIGSRYVYLVGDTGIEKLDLSKNTITFPSDGNIYHRTINSGNTGPGITSLAYNSVFAFDDNNVIAVGDNLISISTNGIDWSDLSINILNNIGDVSLNKAFIFDSNNAVAVGERGTFLYSDTWTNLNSWRKVPTRILNTSGVEDLLVGPTKNLRGVHMTDKRSIIIGVGTDKYEDKSDTSDSSGNLGSGRIQYTFLPNLFDQKNNIILELSGNMNITGNLDIFQSDSDILASSLDASKDLSGSMTIGRDTVFIDIGDSDEAQNIFVNIGDSAKGSRTLKSQYHVINIGANDSKAANNVPPNIINFGNYYENTLASQFLPNIIHIGGGNDVITIDGGGVEFKTESELNFNKHLTFNFTDGENPGVGLANGININSDGITRAGFIESSQDRTGYVFQVPFGTKETNRNVLKIDSSNMVLPTNTNINPLLGIHGVDRGIITLRRLPNLGDGSFNFAVESFDMSNILIRDSSQSNNNMQAISTGIVVDNDVSSNYNLFVGKDASFNTSMFIGTNKVDIDAHLFVTEDASFQSNLVVQNNTVFGDASFNDRLFVPQDASFNSNLFVGKESIIVKDVSINNRLFTNNDVSLNSRLFVKENTTILNDVSMNSRLFVEKDVLVKGNFQVAQNQNQSIIQSTNYNYLFLTILEDMSINGRLFVRDDVSMSGRLFVDENSIFTNDVSMNSRLFVAEDVSFFNTLTLGDDAIFIEDVSINQQLTVKDDVSFNSRIFVKKNSILTNDVSTNMRLFVGGDVSLNKNLYVNNNTIMISDVSVNNTVSVAEDVSFNKSVHVQNRIGIFAPDPKVSLEVNSTKAIKIPQGTTAQAPVMNSTNETGYIRYNLTNDQLEGYTNNSLVAITRLIDTNKDTFIRGETSEGANNNSLDFFTNNLERMRITSSGDLSLNHDLNVVGNSILSQDVSFNQRLFVNNDVSFNNNLFVLQNSTLHGDVSMNNRLFVSQDVSLQQSLFIKNKAIFQNDASINNHLFVNNDVSFGSQFSINKSSIYIQPKAIFNNDVSLNKKLVLHEDASFNKNVVIDGSLRIGGPDSGGEVNGSQNSQNYELKGTQIDGLTSGENSGISVSINSDGTIVAIGAYYFSGGAGNNSGTTRIYEWSGTAWTLKGSQIDGLTGGEVSGISISINSDGTIIAIGASSHNSTRGTTRIYEWSGTAWVLKGSQIDGLATGEYSGNSVSINNAGTIVAIGSYLSSPNTGGSSSGGSSITIECITATSAVNVISSNGNKYVLNGASSYSSTIKYGLSTGTYTFTNIPSNHPIAILNYGNSNISYAAVVNTGSPIIIKVSGGNTSESNGDFYIFKDENNNIINIGTNTTTTFRFMRGKTYIFEADGIGGAHPFRIFMSGVFVNDSGGSNNGISGSSGSITITIPTNHSTTSGDLYYECSVHSNMKKNLSLFYTSVTNSTNNASYDFFYGDITVTVSGNFGNVSLYCYYHGYMGGENLLTYSSTCAVGGSSLSIECITSDSAVNVINSNGNKYVLNGASSYSSTIRYGLSTGTYTFTGIPSDHPLAILNNGNSNITYSGDNNNKFTKSVSGTSYDFFHGDVTVTVTGDFGNVSLYCYYHGYMGGENLLVYSSSCPVGTSSTGGSLSGATRIYEWNGTAWNLKGSQINGQSPNDRFGHNVSINGDGTIVAIGAPYDDDGGAESGSIRIYEWNGTTWVLKGSQINGLAAGEQLGGYIETTTISLNNDGTILAIGVPKANSNIGTTRIYEWNGTAWVLKGSQIDGLTAERSGVSVSINSTGSVVAIGGFNFDGGVGSNSGTTRIYEWDGTAWTLKMQINGLTTGEKSGNAVSLSSDGNVVAIGAYLNDEAFTNAGTTRIYEKLTNGSLNSNKLAFEVRDSSGAPLKDALRFPRGITAERPSPARSGFVRFNTTDDAYEGYGTGWGPLGGSDALVDADNDTLIKFETSRGADEDQIYLFTASKEQLRVYNSGDVSINETLFVSSGSSFISGDISLNNRIFIHGDISLNASIYVKEKAVFESSKLGVNRLFVKSDAILGTTIENSFNQVDVSGQLKVSRVSVNTAPHETYVLNVSGQIQAVSYYATSDSRLKTNVASIEDELDVIEKLHGVSYLFQDSKDKKYGLIAQEVEKVLPDLVYTENDPYQQKSIDYNGILPYLVESVKSLSTSNKLLKSKCKNMKKKMQI